MHTIEFTSKSHDKMIPIPVNYKDWFQKPVKVILLAIDSSQEEQLFSSEEICLAAAVKWYELGRISQEKAAELAGLSREDFIMKLSSLQVSPFQYTAQDLEEELRDVS